MAIFDHHLIRKAICDSLPHNDQSESNLDPKYTYVPPSHAKALNIEHTIVEGMRGAGKSHWWNALTSDDHKKYLEKAFPETGISNDVIVSLGFGERLIGKANWPSKDVLKSLVLEGFNPRDIWKAILGTCAGFDFPIPPSSRWKEKIKWVNENPEEYDELLWEKDEEFANNDKTLLILFDALDRLADDWKEIRPLAKALFQLSLDVRSTRKIRFKIFVRPDMLEDSTILAFPDSSKLIARKVVLNWQRVDLYALLFQCLGNDNNGGRQFREICKDKFNVIWKKNIGSSIWILPHELRNDTDLQKSIFHDIAGPAMAGGAYGHKRGFPYTWLPNHLIDGKDQVSPRSFSAALRHSAEHESISGWDYPLHFNSIKNGVQQASRIRVWEMTNEDYPWVADVMSPLEGLTVPCTDKEIFKLWEENNVLELLKSLNYLKDKEVKLLPPSLDEGNRGLLGDLLNLGIVTLLWDGRVQMPDVYRISFKLGRKGGVKPLK